MKKVLYLGKNVKDKRKMVKEILGLSRNDIERDVKIELIQALIPLGLLHVQELLEEEVRSLAGRKYERKGKEGCYRWTEQWGSAYIGDQKIPISYQRIRKKNGKEVRLEIYERFKKPRDVDERLLRKVLHGLSCRHYKECCEMVPAVFGLSPSTISRRFKEASERKLKEFTERGLDKYDIVAIIVDGKTFQEDEMIIALGITMEGEKIVLGFTQAATENAWVGRDFLFDLLSRGLKVENGILCVIDGSKGLRKAVKDIFKDRALVQRCQWHKRENIVSYLPKKRRNSFRKVLQRAYEKPSYKEAKNSLTEIKKELSLLNESAENSLEEGLEETLTLHRLGLFEELGKSLKTTNCIESLMASIEGRTGRVDYWRTSNQKQRWLAVALLDIEPRLNRIKGYRYLPALREALKKELRIKEVSFERKEKVAV